MAIEFVGFESRTFDTKSGYNQKLIGSGIVSFFSDSWRFAFRCEQKFIRDSTLTLQIDEGTEEFTKLASWEQICSVQLDQPDQFSESRIFTGTITRIEKIKDGLEIELHLHGSLKDAVKH